jgi:hypothetical protein
MKRASAWFDEESDGYVFGLMRLLLGVLLCFQAYRSFETSDHGYFGNDFHLPVVPEAWVPSEPFYLVLLALEVAGGLLAIVGYAGRAGLLVAALAGIYLLACDRLNYHNNRFSVFLVALLCAFTPCDRSFLLFRGRRHALAGEERKGPLWARRLIQFQVSVIYLASGTGKLFDPDWRSGAAMLPRFQQGLLELSAAEIAVPTWVADLVARPWFAELASKAAIATELSLAFGLWFPRTRIAALWLGFAFHLGIELNARVQLFSWLMGVAYIAFVLPEIRERELRFEPSSPAGRLVRRLVPRLDWLARFRLVPAADRDGEPAGARLVLVDRDGTRATGIAALAGLARALPLLFPLWPLLAGIARLRREDA